MTDDTTKTLELTEERVREIIKEELLREAAKGSERRRALNREHPPFLLKRE